MEKRKAMDWEQKTLTTELTQGKELAEQLRNHLDPSSSQETRDLLISKILFSYEKALSVLKWDGPVAESKHIPDSMLESPSSFGNSSSPLSEISDQDCKHKNVFKKRKTMPQWTDQVKVSSGTRLDDDGFSWRKYGQKDILGASYPRAYYRCTHRNSQGCVATKQVQKSEADPTIFEVTYRGVHTCRQVSQLATASASLAKQGLKVPKQSPEISFSFGAGHGLRVKTEDLDTREDDIFTSFSFLSKPIEPENIVGDHIFCDAMLENNFMGIYSPTFASTATFDQSDYLAAVSPCHYMSSFGLGHDVQTSESGLTEIISAPTSVTNSPIGDFGFSLDDLDFQPFENPECFV